MKKLKQSRLVPVSEINIVPYVDVMLVLLVIFMITAPVLTQGVQVELPKAASKTIRSDGIEPLIISVDREGRYYFNKASKPDTPLSAKKLMLLVAAELRIESEKNRFPKVLVKGDKDVQYGRVVKAMSHLKFAGASQVGLMTDDREA